VAADHSDQTMGVLASAATAVLIVPLVVALKPHLHSGTQGLRKKAVRLRRVFRYFRHFAL
jgi:FSR family fosmidomycin resistance protein-like MFS transporter